MSYHYHVIECPHCHLRLQRGCGLKSCTTAAVSTEPFVSSDGHVADRATCIETGGAYYIDYGDRPRASRPAPALRQYSTRRK